jgi:T4 RnlA family RNA ligase
MNNLREWFKENGFATLLEGAEKLTEELGITIKEYPEEDLYVLNYSQIDSPKTNPVVIECRGLIVDNNLNVVCLPFNRFFNIGEALEITADFDFSNAEFFEKADGSLVKVYCHKGVWNIGTRGTAFAESANYTGETFCSLVLEAFGCTDMQDFQQKMEGTPKEYTYLFEYTSPKNRVVTPYTDNEMVLIGVRCHRTSIDIGDEETLMVLANRLKNTKGLNVRPAKVYHFDAKEDLLEAVQRLTGLQEGFVCYSYGERIKVKSDLYVQVHKLRGDNIPTPKRIAELVVTNEVDEYLAYFPEDRKLFDPYVKSYNQMLTEAQNKYDKYCHIESQKEFAMQVKNDCYFSLLFSARKNQTDVTTEFKSLDTSKRKKIFLVYKGN